MTKRRRRLSPRMSAERTGRGRTGNRYFDRSLAVTGDRIDHAERSPSHCKRALDKLLETAIAFGELDATGSAAQAREADQALQRMEQRFARSCFCAPGGSKALRGLRGGGPTSPVPGPGDDHYLNEGCCEPPLPARGKVFTPKELRSFRGLERGGRRRGLDKGKGSYCIFRGKETIRCFEKKATATSVAKGLGKGYRVKKVKKRKK